jgi:hypothetical protein
MRLLHVASMVGSTTAKKLLATVIFKRVPSHLKKKRSSTSRLGYWAVSTLEDE